MRLFFSSLSLIMNEKKQVFNRIKAYLALKQIKNKDLAAHLGVSVQTVSKWCTNYSQPSIPELYRIAGFLKVNVYELLVPNDDQEITL